ncbi:MAG TPA: response regulator [Anaeromyxobacter sp.]
MGDRILLVEDEATTLSALRDYFAHIGYDVDCARARDEAVERLASTRYPVVIADLLLSKDGGGAYEGLDVVERVRRDHPGTRVVVLTACGAELEPEARRRGADCFLEKPQPLARLAEIVRTLCRGRA